MSTSPWVAPDANDGETPIRPPTASPTPAAAPPRIRDARVSVRSLMSVIVTPFLGLLAARPPVSERHSRIAADRFSGLPREHPSGDSAVHRSPSRWSASRWRWAASGDVGRRRPAAYGAEFTPRYRPARHRHGWLW